MNTKHKFDFSEAYAKELVDRMPQLLRATMAALGLHERAFLNLWADCLQWSADTRPLSQWASLQLWKGAQASPWWKSLSLITGVTNKLETNTAMIRTLQKALREIASLIKVDDGHP